MRVSKKILAVAVATAMGVLGVATAPWSQADTVNYPAQGGKWSRIEEATRSRYLLASPLVGSSKLPADEPMRSGIRSFQQLLNAAGATVAVDGVYGRGTAAAVSAFQRKAGLPVTGILGYPTAKALLTPLVTQHATASGMDPNLLMCHLSAESNLDAGAVGINGSDLGIAQISLEHNPSITAEQTFDVNASIRYMAQRDATAFKKYKDWRVAIVSYNSPSAANLWKRTGHASDRAANYAARAVDTCMP